MCSFTETTQIDFIFMFLPIYELFLYNKLQTNYLVWNKFHQINQILKWLSMAKAKSDLHLEGKWAYNVCACQGEFGCIKICS